MVQVINNALFAVLLCFLGFIFLFKPSVIVALIKPEEKVECRKGIYIARILIGLGLLVASIFLFVSTALISYPQIPYPPQPFEEGQEFIEEIPPVEEPLPESPFKEEMQAPQGPKD